MLDVRRLRLLWELQLRGSLANVAAALNASPSSVSQQLALLEKEAGVPLLRKAGRGVQLTPQGEILAAHAAAILELLEVAETDLAASLEEVTGSVRIAVFQSAALAFMPQVLNQLSAAHPRLRVTMTQHEPETAMHGTAARDFDLVVAEQYPGHSAPWPAELDRVPLTTDEIRLAVPSSGPLSHVRTIEQAADAPWVMEPTGAASRHFAEQTGRQAGFEPDVRFETADLQAQVRLIASGTAVALLPGLMLRDATRDVTTHELGSGPVRHIFTSVRHASARQPGIKACRAALASAAEESHGRS